MRSTAKATAEYVGGLTIGQGRYAGEPFRLLGWQRRFLSGTFKQPGDAALSMGRGGGKSTFIAAVSAAAVDAGGPLVVPMAETVIVCSSFDQGYQTVFRHLMWFLRPSFERYGRGPRDRFRVQDSANRATVTDRETGAMVRVLGSDPRRMHGLQPRLLVFDEVAQWPPTTRDRALAALKTSRGKIPDSRALWLGTRPADPSHPFQRALDGHGVAFSLSYQARPDDPPFQRKTWVKANPSLRGGFPDLEATIREEAEDAKRDPEALASFLSLRLNMGLEDTAVSVLIGADAWARAQRLPEPEHRGGFVLGLDLGTSAAMSAASAYFRDGRLDAVAVFPHHPSLKERGVADGVGRLYERMADRGELVQAGQRVSDIPALLSQVLARWGRPQAVVCDRWREQELRQHMGAVGFPQAALMVRGMGFRDGSEDVRAFRRAVLGGYVKPADSLLLTAAMSEARTVSDPSGNSKLAKSGQAGRRVRARDDAAAASLLAVAAGYRQWHTSPARRRGLRSALVG